MLDNTLRQARLMVTILSTIAVMYGQAVAADDSDDIEDSAGDVLYERWCTSCHGSSRHAPGSMALQVKYNGAIPVLLEERDDINLALLTYYIRQGVSVMPSFRPTEISDDDIAAIYSYLSSSALQHKTRAKPATEN